MRTTTRLSTQLARWGVIVATILMGGALLATALSTYQGVQRASGTLVRGQADVFLDSLRGRLFRSGLDLTEAELTEILETTLAEHEGDGLLYITASPTGAASWTRQ